jgi:hypothetical protein
MKKRGYSRKHFNTNNHLLKCRRSQIWVETVIYTLIGLTIIGIVVGIVTPRIKQMGDKAVIEQTLSAMIDFHEKVLATQVAPGNTRIVDLRIKKGKIVIDGKEDSIYFVLDETTLKYSEPGVPITQGDITILTNEKTEGYNVSLILDYKEELNVTYSSSDTEKVFTQAPTSYRIQIENKGKTNGVNNLNIRSV